MMTGTTERRPPPRLVASALACLALLTACAGCASATAAGGSHPVQPSIRWQLLRIPRSIARTWDLEAVSCPTAQFCMVVGADRAGAAAATLTGSAWHVLRPVEREASGVFAGLTSEFRNVYCVSATDCVAVGDMPVSNGNERPLAEHWNGTRWSVQATAALKPAGWAQWFSSVSCPSATTCMAAAQVGSAAAGTGADGAAEIWHPGAPRWRNSGLRGATWLLGVSCVSDVHCVAISADAIYTWNRGRWARQRVQGLGSNQPSAISCTSVTRCVVIAGSDPATSFVLRGRTWTMHAIPGYRGNNWTWFGGISCPAANSCTAVGSVTAHNQDETSTLLVEHWNGASWRVQPVVPVPYGAGTSLSSVSCPAPADCVTVGGQDTLSSLAERSS